MARDVDLSSKQWLDIVFDGKNKEFGAYKLRQDSVRRHTKATIIVLSVVVIICCIPFALKIVDFLKPEEDTVSTVDQTLANLGEEENTEEEEVMEQIKEDEPEPEQEEIIEEEVQASVANTILDIVDDDKITNEKQNNDELTQTDAAAGTVTVDGISDYTKTVVTDQVIVEEEKPKPEPKQDIVYTVANVQQQPQFPGGDAEMYKWLSSHIQYPASAAEEGVEGRVVVEFVVDKTGAITKVKVVRGKHPALDKEAVRVVSAMPNWNPGKNNGEPVKVTYNLPVTFKLQK